MTYWLSLRSTTLRRRSHSVHVDPGCRELVKRPLSGDARPLLLAVVPDEYVEAFFACSRCVRGYWRPFDQAPAGIGDWYRRERAKVICVHCDRDLPCGCSRGAG